MILGKDELLKAEQEGLVNILDRKDFSALATNPDISFKDLAQRVEVSQNTLKKLLENLKRNKVILAFQTLIDKDLLGIQHYKLFLSFDFNNKNKLKVVELLKNHPNVIYISETSYSFDLECEVYTLDNSSFEKTIRDLKGAFPFRRIVISQMKSEEKLS